MLKRQTLILIAAPVATAGALALWLAVRAPAVTVVKPERGPAVEAIYATGTVEPVRWVKAGPTLAGRIVEFRCLEGVMVAQGEVLARLDDALARARLAEVEAMVRFRQLEVDRYGTLARTQAASRQAHERAVADLEQVTASLAAARQELDETVVRAPLDGMVLREDGEVGQVVAPGEPLCWIGQEKPLRVTAEVDEEDIPRLAIGQRALIKADAFPERTLDGHVAEITPQGDPLNKSYRARIALPADSPLLVGMTVELNIIVREAAEAILIPVEALNGGAVWLVEDGVLIRRAVTPGVFGAERVEIRAGLDGQESVALDVPAGAQDGERVNARER
jgi:RND family efflux transporter MFP subunit